MYASRDKYPPVALSRKIAGWNKQKVTDIS